MLTGLSHKTVGIRDLLLLLPCDLCKFRYYDNDCISLHWVKLQAGWALSK
jgi:hypothetical protein